MAETDTNPADRWLAPALGFVAGYVDTCGFIALFGLFTAHVTGNFVLIGAALVSGASGLALKLLALPTFVLVVAAVAAFVQFAPPAPRRRTGQLLLVQALLVGAFGCAGILAQPIAHADSAAALGVGLLGVAAMSIQNAASRLVMGTLAPSTVMTGNVTQMVIDAVSMLKPSAAGANPASARLAKFAWPLLGFAGGAIAGAWLLAKGGFGALLLPAAILLVLAWRQLRGSTPA